MPFSRYSVLFFSRRRSEGWPHRGELPQPRFKSQSVQKIEWKQTNERTDGWTDRRTLAIVLRCRLTRLVNIERRTSKTTLSSKDGTFA